jgi:hypothetical protein
MREGCGLGVCPIEVWESERCSAEVECGRALGDGLGRQDDRVCTGRHDLFRPTLHFMLSRGKNLDPVESSEWH